MSISTQKPTYTICTPWQLPDACSRTVNRYCLYSSMDDHSINDNKQDIMKSQEFNYGQPSRHIALKSNHLLSVGHGELFTALGPFEIRCIYPYVTAGLTIISFYKLSDARKSIEIIQSQFSHLYTTCYVKPCLINKNLNESVFVTVRSKSNDNSLTTDYVAKLSRLDTISYLSEAAIGDDLKVVNVEFDDERTHTKVLKEYHNISIGKNTQLESFEAKNNQFMCSCHGKHDLRWNQQDQLPTYFLNSRFIEMDNGISSSNDSLNKIYYSKNHENHSFFSVDPFSLKSSKSTISSSSSDDDDSLSSCTTSDHSDSWHHRSKRESYDSAMMTCSTTSKELRLDITSDENNVNSDREYVTPTMSPTTTTASSSSTVSSTTTKTVKTNGKKAKDEKTNDFDLENIINGKDTRTTFMIRNIPNKYTQQMLMDCINETHANTYDFLYLRIDFKNKCNVGYAFINFINVESVVSFYKNREGKKWKLFNSDKKCSLSYANIQGKEALIRKFKNSQVMDEDDAYKPKLFFTEGVHKGKEQPFPKPDESPNTSKHRESKNLRHRYHRKRC